MKFLLAILLFSGSLVAFAMSDELTNNFPHSSAHSLEYYHGSGVFKKPSGERAEFIASLTIRDLDSGSLNFIYGIYLDNKNMHYSIVLNERAGESFFDVMSEGETVGYGYCLGGTCHFEYSLWGYHVEDTVKQHRRDGSLTCIGSKRNENGIVKSWKMSLNRIL